MTNAIEHRADRVGRGRPALGAITEGIRYQLGFFWREALRVLYDELVERVEMEAPGAGSVDDVVVYYVAPGCADRGAFVDADYYQLKFHVGMGALTSAALTERKKAQPSLLAKFAAAWRRLRETMPRLRLTLVTNWAWATNEPLSAHVEHDGTLKRSFFEATPRSKVGKIRNAWQRVVGLEDAEFQEFCAALRLVGSGVSQAEAETWLRDRWAIAGVDAAPLSKEGSNLLELGLKLLGTGRTVQDRASLTRLLDAEGLRKSSRAPYQSTLAVRSFARHALEPGPEGPVRVDLVDLFEHRQARGPEVWDSDVPRRLEGALDEVARLPQPIRLAVDAHLSIAWFLGTLLPSKAGLQFVLAQKSVAGTALWDGTGVDGAGWNVRREPLPQGADLAVAISTKHDIARDVRAAIARYATPAGELLLLDLSGSADDSVKSGLHAISLADAAVHEIRSALDGRAGRVHLFFACPWTLAFLLGQRFHVIGGATAYDYALGSARTYEPTLDNDNHLRR